MEQLHRISDWFDSFVATFCGKTTAEQRNYELKIVHTQQVRVCSERLSASLNFTPEERALAAAIAICHDVGRFPQYQRYGTFNDAASTNHATLALQTLKTAGVLSSLAAEDRSVLLAAVALHNVFILPPELDPLVRRFAMLIRDADKLDIWRVMIENCSAAPDKRASAVFLELPETGRCSRQALAEVVAGRMPNRELLASVDDIKLLQLSWAYDLNFSESFRIMNERNYLESLANLLPEEPGCRAAVEVVRAFVLARLAES
ncbi:MAG: HD domain-containing protein [Desulfuromonadales bacterium]|nr:HD domain-containing protein [Desulfuromonadales bacterium]